jgi:hypothetical protein
MADEPKDMTEEERALENQARADRGEPPLNEPARDESDVELASDKIGNALDPVIDRHPVTGSMDMTPGGSAPGDLADPEEQKKLIKYFDQERPWMREQMAADQARDDKARDEVALKDAATKIEADRTQKDPDDDRKSSRTEYQPGSYKPDPEQQHDRDREGR